MAEKRITWTSDITVEITGQYGDDERIARAAWVSSGKDPLGVREAEVRRVIRKLARDLHGTPFESGYLEARIVAPRAVRDEHVRHRIGSYSSSSLRYRAELVLQETPLSVDALDWRDDEASFYIPPAQRPLRKAAGHRQIRPQYTPLAFDDWVEYVRLIKHAIVNEVNSYNDIWRLCPSTEAVRWVTSDNLIVPYIARFNPRNLMAFIALRTHNEDANHVSFPMWEIEQVALQLENALREHWPITWEAFNTFGREAP